MRAFVDELPVKLTSAQRSVLAETSSPFRDRLRLDEPGQRTVKFRLADLKVLRDDVGRALHAEEDGRKNRSLQRISEIVEEATRRFFEIDAIPTSERLYQLRITLKDSTPKVWRRVQVKECSLKRLHSHIQRAMGWKDYHLWSFEIGGIEYADLDLVEDFFGDDARDVRLGDLVPKSGQRLSFLYHYDFGDDWKHEILFEGCLRVELGSRYPKCLEGERACPPEDVGGIFGFANYLAALADPSHNEHKAYIEWGGSFDPAEFSTGQVTKRMQRS